MDQMGQIDLENFKAASQQAKGENQQFLKRLGKWASSGKKARQLDGIFQDTHEEVFEEIDCLACANCCKTTSPRFTERDVDRIAAHLRVRPAAFVERYLHRDEEGDLVLKQAPCAFLGSDNYCSIYEVRPRACREYPHTDRKQIRQLLKLTARNTEVCPAVLEIVERIKANWQG